MEFIFADSAEEVIPLALTTDGAQPALASVGGTPTRLPGSDGTERRSARAAAKKRSADQRTQD
jgi:hypothetical protein